MFHKTFSSDVDVHRTWEFNKTQPLRSPTVPFLLYGVPMGALKVFNIVLFHYTGLNVVGNYIVTLIPKLVLLLLSFSVDYLVYKEYKIISLIKRRGEIAQIKMFNPKKTSHTT